MNFPFKAEAMESDQDMRGTGRDSHLWHSCLAPTWAIGLFSSFQMIVMAGDLPLSLMTWGEVELRKSGNKVWNGRTRQREIPQSDKCPQEGSWDPGTLVASSLHVYPVYNFPWDTHMQMHKEAFRNTTTVMDGLGTSDNNIFFFSW